MDQMTSGGIGSRGVTDLARQSLGRWRHRVTILRDRVYDRRLGVETTTELWSGVHQPYQPTSWGAIKEALSLVTIRGGTFVDFGSGKGRVVIAAASTRMFDSVIGIEIDARLALQSRANLLRCRRPVMTPVEIIEADMLDWQPPPSTSVAFLFNPLSADLTRAMALRLSMLIPGTLEVVYVNAVGLADFVEAGFTLVEHRIGRNIALLRRGPRSDESSG